MRRIEARTKPTQPAGRMAHLVAAVVMCVAVVACWTSGAAAQTPAPSTAASITLLGQDTTVGGPLESAKFHLRVALSGDTKGDTLQATLYQELTNRTDFQASLHDNLYSEPFRFDQWPVSALKSDPLGGVDAVAPLAGWNLTTGLYPIQLQLVDPNGNPVGNLITTYLVYVQPGWGLPKLSVAFALPLGGAPSIAANGSLATRIPSGESASLSAVAGALGSIKGGVPISLAMVPQTMAALAQGNETDRTTVGELASSVALNHDEVLPAPYVRLNLPAMLAAGLNGEVDRQLATGSETLGRWFPTPNNQTWLLPDPLNQSVIDALADRGTTNVVVPGQDLTPPPASYANNTFAYPTNLAVPGKHVEVAGEDVGLQAHFTDGPNQALDAYQLLAELAMIEVEQPGLVRGVAVVPPAGWTPNATFLSVLLHGLAGNPLLRPVTLSGLFADVQPATTDGVTATRSLIASAKPSDLGDVTALSQAVKSLQAHLRAYESIAPSAGSVISTAQQELLSVESADLSTSERARLVSQLKTTLRDKLDQVQLPTNVSITLTSRQGAIPVTIVNKSHQPVHVRLRLTSQKLGFDPFKPSDGTCAREGPSAEQCQLTLPSQALTLRIPVEARTSGVFVLSLTLLTPDGTLPLSSSQYTVRSTAISSVGIILIVAAALCLAFWWIRQHRRRRRALALLEGPPPPEPDPAPADVALVPPPPEPSAAETIPSPAPPGSSSAEASDVSGVDRRPNVGNAALATLEALPEVRLRSAVPAAVAAGVTVVASTPSDSDREPSLSGPEEGDRLSSYDGGRDNTDDASTGRPVAPKRQPANQDGPGGEQAPPPTDDGRPAPRTWLDDDPVLAEFFRSPAPDYASQGGLSFPTGELGSPAVSPPPPAPRQRPDERDRLQPPEGSAPATDAAAQHPPARDLAPPAQRGGRPPAPSSGPTPRRPVRIVPSRGLTVLHPGDLPGETSTGPPPGSTRRQSQQAAPPPPSPTAPSGAPTRPATPSDSRQSITRNTGLVSLGIFCSRLSGFAKLLALTWVLGSYRLGDAYNLANTVPNIVYNLVLGGVLSATLIPVFVEQLGRRSTEEGMRAVSAVITVITAALLGLTVIFWFFARPIIDFYLISTGGRVVADERAVAVHLLHFFVPQLFLLGGIAVTEALLNARRRFANPAFSPVLCNLVTIAAVVATGMVARNMHIGVFRTDEAALLVLGLGTTLGYLVQFGVQLPPLFREGFRFRPVWDLHHPAVRTVLRLSAWTFGAIVTNQVSLNLILVMASRHGGNVTEFSNAYNFFQFPYAIFAVSIAAVIAPDLAERWSRGDRRGFGVRVASGLRLTLAILVPAGLGYAVIAETLMRLTLQHGAVTAGEAHLTGAILALFALGLPGFSTFLLLMRAYQSMQDTKSMFWLYAVENGLTVILALALYPSLGLRGLVLGWVGAYTLVSIPAYLHVRHRSLGFGGNNLTRPLLRILAPALIMAAAIDVLGAIGPQSSGVGVLLARLVIEIAVGTMLYLFGAWLFRVSEIGVVLAVALPIRRGAGSQTVRRQSRSDRPRRVAHRDKSAQPYQRR